MRNEDKKNSGNRSSADRKPLLLRDLKRRSGHYRTPIYCLHRYLILPI